MTGFGAKTLKIGSDSGTLAALGNGHWTSSVSEGVPEKLKVNRDGGRRAGITFLYAKRLETNEVMHELCVWSFKVKIQRFSFV